MCQVQSPRRSLPDRCENRQWPRDCIIRRCIAGFAEKSLTRNSRAACRTKFALRPRQSQSVNFSSSLDRRNTWTGQSVPHKTLSATSSIRGSTPSILRRDAGDIHDMFFVPADQKKRLFIHSGLPPCARMITSSGCQCTTSSQSIGCACRFLAPGKIEFPV